MAQTPYAAVCPARWDTDWTGGMDKVGPILDRRRGVWGGLAATAGRKALTFFGQNLMGGPYKAQEGPSTLRETQSHAQRPPSAFLRLLEASQAQSTAQPL
jgi:hypothetical protein